MPDLNETIRRSHYQPHPDLAGLVYNAQEERIKQIQAKREACLGEISDKFFRTVAETPDHIGSIRRADIDSWFDKRPTCTAVGSFTRVVIDRVIKDNAQRLFGDKLSIDTSGKYSIEWTLDK